MSSLQAEVGKQTTRALLAMLLYTRDPQRQSFDQQVRAAWHQRWRRPLTPPPMPVERGTAAKVAVPVKLPTVAASKPLEALSEMISVLHEVKTLCVRVGGVPVLRQLLDVLE